MFSTSPDDIKRIIIDDIIYKMHVLQQSKYLKSCSSSIEFDNMYFAGETLTVICEVINTNKVEISCIIVDSKNIEYLFSTICPIDNINSNTESVLNMVSSIVQLFFNDNMVGQPLTF